MASPWQWDVSSKRYRDSRSGRYLSPAAMVRLRDQFAAEMEAKGKASTEKLAEGTRTLQQWEAEQRKSLKQTFVDQYVMGKGGRSQMTQADWGKVGALLKTQYQYLAGFSADLAAGKLTPAQATARSSLYYASSVQAYEVGHAAAWGVRLSQYPGSGQTACGVNCKCRLDIQPGEIGGTVEVYWRLGKAEHCADCVSLSQTWNPLVVAASSPGLVTV